MKLQNLNEFDDELQGGVRRDGVAGTVLAIGEVVRQVELVLGALGHQLQAFGPALDDLVQAEDGRFASLVGAVEDLPDCLKV